MKIVGRYILSLATFMGLGCSLSVFAQTPDTAFARECLDLSEKYAQNRQFDQAVSWGIMALEIYENHTPPFYERAVFTMGELARHYRKMGQYERSYEYYTRSIEWGETYLSPYDSTLLKNLNGLGVYFYYLGNCEKALEVYQTVLERRIKLLGPMHEEVANAYNNIAICFDQLGKHYEATDFYRKSLDIRLKLKGDKNTLVADGYLNLGNSFHYLGDYNAALDSYQKALTIYLAEKGEAYQDITVVYNNMGVCFQTKGDYARARELLQKSLNLYEEIYGPQHPEVANALNNLGINYYFHGDYNKALLYFQRALSVRRKHFEESHPLVASLYSHIGNCYRKKKQYAQALAYSRNAMLLRRERFGPAHKEVADSYQDLGQYFQEVGNYAEALHYYQQALAINRKQLGADHPLVGDGLELIGHAYLAQGRYREARDHFQEALKVKTRSLGGRHPEIAVLWTALAQCETQRPEVALERLSQALDILDLDVCEGDPLAAVANPLPFLKALNARGEIQLQQYMRTGTPDWLVESDQTFALALRIIDALRKSFQEPESKQLLLDQFYQVFEKSLEVKFLFYQQQGDISFLEKAFTIAENSKNVLLLDAVQKSHADHFAGLPDDLLERESDLRIELAYLEQQRFKEEQKGSSSDPHRLAQFRQELFDLKRSFYQLMDTLATHFPDYYELRYGRPPIALDSLRKAYLRPGTTLLEYFVGERAIFLFVLADHGARMVRVEKDFPLQEWVSALRSSIDHYDPLSDAGVAAVRAYQALSDSLYNRLVLPVESALTDTALLIVPDGVLGYLPFECLSVAGKGGPASNWKDMPFLIHRYQISYSYAAHLLFTAARDFRREAAYPFVAFAPDFQEKRTFWVDNRPVEWYPLRFNQEEVARILPITGGKAYLGAEATASRFGEEASRYRILHLATHAQASDSIGSHAFLAFTPPGDTSKNALIYVRDLYNMNLAADLVVLSACETGVGEWQRGEGIISLGRGFLFAGAGSLVTTLWQVDDASTADVMEHFYTNLKLGMSKDRALRQAKLAFLRENSSIRAHPLFWASFVPVGEMAPLEWPEPTLFSGWWLLPVLLGLPVLLWLFWKGPLKKNR